ncbi:MAG TPA: response regulator transcription factor [Candidatus Binatia bacterium]|nr:response regulator transcription factor [Candidatus Binatia bacterium]
MNAPTSSAVGVLIADSNRMQAQLLTAALRRRSEFHVAHCPGDSPSVLHALEQPCTQVLVLSLSRSLPVAEQLATLREVHIAHPQLAKVLLVESYDRDLVLGAFRAGVQGIFCISEMHFRLLCRCIQRVAEGQIWANSEQLRFLLELITEVPAMRVVNAQGRQVLTPREEQVVGLVAEGMSNRDIARELDLSHHTVKKYVFRIFDKLGVSSRVELVLYAVNHGRPHPGYVGPGDGGAVSGTTRV